MQASPPSRKPSKADRRSARKDSTEKKSPMLTQIDHLVIATDDLEAAQAQCVALLGRSPSWSGDHPASGARNVIFRLANTCVELRAPGGERQGAEELSAHLEAEGPGLFALALLVADRSEAFERLDLIWSEGQGALIRRDRPVEVVHSLVAQPQIGVDLGERRAGLGVVFQRL